MKVTFARHLPDNLKKLQEQSFQHHNKKSQEERWMHTNYIPVYDIQAEVSCLDIIVKLIIFFFKEKYIVNVLIYSNAAKKLLHTFNLLLLLFF